MKHIESETLNNYFIESTNIKVFPCSYRGFDSSGNIYDPESTGFTEYNFVNIYGKQTKLISWTNQLLKCVIGGYYFEIKNINPSDLCINNVLYKFIIIPGDLTIIGDYKTWVLDPIKVDTANYLDTLVSGTNCFVGLSLIPVNESPAGAIEFSPCKLITNADNTKTAEIDWQAYRLTDIIASGYGAGSIKMLGTSKKNQANEIISTACYANGENSLAIGISTTAGGECSISGGNKSTANGTNSIAIGDHVVANAENQVVFGSYNDATKTTAALIIGNGNNAEQASNSIELYKNGDINTTGKLTINGDITNASGGLRLLNNGFIDVVHNIEYVKLSSNAVYSADKTYYELDTTTDEVTEKEVTAETFDDLKDNLYEEIIHSSSLTENGDLFIDGNAEINKTLQVNETATIEADIIGHKDIILSKEGLTHNLIIGSENGVSDYGSIKVYGTKSVNGQEAKTIAFSVDNKGTAKIEKTLVVGDKLKVEDTGTTINNTKLTIADPTTINNTLAVNGAVTIKDNNIITTINKDAINHNNGKFIATKDGDISANSLTLAGSYDVVTRDDENNEVVTTVHYGIDKDGKISCSELALKDGYKISANGDATLKDLIINNATLDGIRLEKGSYSVKDTDNTRTINNNNALKITKYVANTDPNSANTFIEQSQGLHVNGIITAAGDFAIGESDGATTKITHGGTAYFKQGLLVGGKITDSNSDNDTATLRIKVFGENNELQSAAILKGDLNVTTYGDDDPKGGNLTVKKDAKITGDLIVGDTNAGIKIGADGKILRAKKIESETFNAIQIETSSDIRKKTAIKDYSCKNSILDLPVKEFEYIDDATHTKHIGCIAQDLQEICPEIVHEDADGYLSIEENKLVYLLLQEVKELKKEIKSLKGE